MNAKPQKDTVYFPLKMTGVTAFRVLMLRFTWSGGRCERIKHRYDIDQYNTRYFQTGRKSLFWKYDAGKDGRSKLCVCEGFIC